MTKVYWCPKPETSAARTLGSIQVEKGSILSEEEYMLKLAERVQEMVDADPNPKAAAQMVERAMEEAGLMPGRMDGPEDAGDTLIASSPVLPDYLRAKGLLTSFPMRVNAPTPRADSAVEDKTLEEWAEEIRPDRTLD